MAAWEKGVLAYGTHDIPFTPDAPTSYSFFSHGHADGEGYVECAGFYSGDRYFYYAYEQTQLEVLIGRLHGIVDYSADRVTFDGVTERLEQGYLSDGVVGIVVWSVDI